MDTLNHQASSPSHCPVCSPKLLCGLVPNRFRVSLSGLFFVFNELALIYCSSRATICVLLRLFAISKIKDEKLMITNTLKSTKKGNVFHIHEPG
jgi:hypothetical protein